MVEVSAGRSVRSAGIAGGTGEPGTALGHHLATTGHNVVLGSRVATQLTVLLSINARRWRHTGVRIPDLEDRLVADWDVDRA